MAAMMIITSSQFYQFPLPSKFSIDENIILIADMSKLTLIFHVRLCGDIFLITNYANNRGDIIVTSDIIATKRSKRLTHMRPDAKWAKLASLKSSLRKLFFFLLDMTRGFLFCPEFTDSPRYWYYR